MKPVTIDVIPGTLGGVCAAGGLDGPRERSRQRRRPTFLLWRERATSGGRVPQPNVQCYDRLYLSAAFRILSGAVSGIMSMAQSPAALATSMYQAGASALPVKWISQVTTG